ncbi:MAG: hypothetical protein AB1349_09005 [Elusimicrobiota bacterium]
MDILLVVSLSLIALVCILLIYYVITRKKTAAREKKITSMSELKKELRRKSHKLVEKLIDEMKVDIYDNIIVSTVISWFDGWATLEELSNTVKKNVEERIPYWQKKIELSFADLEESFKVEEFGFPDQTIDTKKVSSQLTGLISLIIGAVSTCIGSIIAGGSGIALISSGPVGVVIGVVALALAYFVGKSTVDELLNAGLHKVPFPPVFKKFLKSKVSNELKRGSNKFVQELYLALTNAVDEALKD